MVKEPKLSPSEAVYGFAGWLTSGPKKVVMSKFDDAGIVADLVKQFCEQNNLGEPRESWEKNLHHPHRAE